MPKILAFTDLHFRKEGETIIGLDPVKRFGEVRDAALAAHSDADIAILMGDLAHTGATQEYERLSQALTPFPMPVVPMLGNHDSRYAFRTVFHDAPDQDGFVQTLQDIGDIRIITLDSLDEPKHDPIKHSGYLCPTRLEFLKTALATASGRQVLVFCHHPPFPVGFPAMDGIRLSNGDELMDILATYPRLHLFCGHIHRTISGSVQGVPFTIFKSPCHQMPFDFGSDDSSSSTDEPGAYGLILADVNGVIVHTEDVGLERKTHTGSDAVVDH